MIACLTPSVDCFTLIILPGNYMSKTNDNLQVTLFSPDSTVVWSLVMFTDRDLTFKLVQMPCHCILYSDTIALLTLFWNGKKFIKSLIIKCKFKSFK